MREILNSRSPAVLVVGSRYDFTCDYVVAALRRRGASYLRLNCEDVPNSSFRLDPVIPELVVQLASQRFRVTGDNLRGVFFRRSTYDRPAPSITDTASSLLASEQWAVFLRSLMVFLDARWMNEPSATYRAEHKPLQLLLAVQVGFDVPRTVVLNGESENHLPAGRRGRVAIKGLDTVLLEEEGLETFAFTTIVSGGDLDLQHQEGWPFIVQEALEDKLDLRVTVVGDKVYAAAITDSVGRIDGDWRRQARSVRFEPFQLPEGVRRMCVDLTSRLGLSFAGIDLVESGGTFFFLEINPLGEWAWLLRATKSPIDEAIAEYLLGR